MYRYLTQLRCLVLWRPSPAGKRSHQHRPRTAVEAIHLPQRLSRQPIPLNEPTLRLSARTATRTGTSPRHHSAPPLPGFTSLLSLSPFFLSQTSLVPGSLSCILLSDFLFLYSSPVDRSSFLLYPQPNIPFFFLLLFLLSSPFAIRSFHLVVFVFHLRTLPTIQPCQSVCDTRLIPPFVWHSKRTNNVASPRGPVEFLTTGWNLRRAISKPAPVFPPNTTRTRTPHREAQRGGNLADKRRFETALLSPLQFSDTRISALKLEGRSTAQGLE